jgi:hypothetical protein
MHREPLFLPLARLKNNLTTILKAEKGPPLEIVRNTWRAKGLVRHYVMLVKNIENQSKMMTELTGRLNVKRGYNWNKKQEV